MWEEWRHMAVPVIVFFGCFILGVAAAVRWLPALAEGSIGGLAFFVVCGLLAAALGVLGVGIEEVVRTLEAGRGELGREFVGAALVTMGRDAGLLFGLATVVYLLAPREQRPAPLSEGGLPE